jgi:hypothetical protein
MSYGPELSLRQQNNPDNFAENDLLKSVEFSEPQKEALDFNTLDEERLQELSDDQLDAMNTKAENELVEVEGEQEKVSEKGKAVESSIEGKQTEITRFNEEHPEYAFASAGGEKTAEANANGKVEEKQTQVLEVGEKVQQEHYYNAGGQDLNLMNTTARAAEEGDRYTTEKVAKVNSEKNGQQVASGEVAEVVDERTA